MALVGGAASRIGVRSHHSQAANSREPKDKIKLLPPKNPAAHAIANGEAEIGMTQIS